MNTKYCSRCDSFLPIENFYKFTRGDFSWLCINHMNEYRRDRYKNITKESETLSNKKYREQNLERLIKANKKHVIDKRKERREKINDYLKTHPCIDCGETDPIVLDFDHVRGIKLFGVRNQLVTRPWKSIEEEIKKCDVRCANCHRRKHYKERNK